MCVLGCRNAAIPPSAVKKKGGKKEMEVVKARTATAYTLNHQPSTLNPQPSTLNPQPSTLNPKSSTPTPLNPKPHTLNP